MGVVVGFESLRVKLVQTPVAPIGGTVRVDIGPPGSIGQLRPPFAVIARIRNDTATTQRFALNIDGRPVCERSVRGGIERIDCAGQAGWGPTGDHVVEVVGGTFPWRLEYLELATHHGATRSYDLIILPAASHNYAGPTATWVVVAWLGLVLVFMLPSAPMPRQVTALYRTMSVLVITMVALIFVSRFVSRYAVLLSVLGFSQSLSVLLAPRLWFTADWLWQKRTRTSFNSPTLFVDALKSIMVRHGVLVAIGAAALTTMLGFKYGTFSAAGADPYGYVSQADLWLNRHLRVDQRWLGSLPDPFDDWSFSPLGYRPGPEPHTIVPTYSAGLPLLMAAAKFVAGSDGPYYVVPLLGGLAVLLTFLLGRLLFDEMVGMAASLLLAASPAFLFMLMFPMSDVPVASAWTLALVFATLRRPLAAGFASSLAIVIRPNLLLLSLGVSLIASGPWRGADGLIRTRWRDALTRAFLCCLGVVPGVLGVALLNRHLYGGALQSGYGNVQTIYHWSYLHANLARYPRWLARTQTPFVIAAVLPLASSRFAGSTAMGRHWSVRAGLALFIALLFASYLFYIPFDEWWYLRFILPVYPIMLVLATGSIRSMQPLRSRTSHFFLVAAVLTCVLGWEVTTEEGHVVFHLREGERRYVTIGRELAITTPSNAVFFAMHESGSLRYYAHRLTVRYDNLRPGSLDQAIDALRERGFRPYFLLEKWEEAAFRERFSHGSRAGRLDWPPVRTWGAQVSAALYDPGDIYPLTSAR
jgi:hypothetical protein